MCPKAKAITKQFNQLNELRNTFQKEYTELSMKEQELLLDYALKALTTEQIRILRLLEEFPVQQISELDAKALTYDELEDLYLKNRLFGVHVWVKTLYNDGIPPLVHAAILDAYYEDGVAAVVGFHDEQIFSGKDYGKTWLAYLEKPVYC